jgi:hypothetical protein
MAENNRFSGIAEIRAIFRTYQTCWIPQKSYTCLPKLQMRVPCLISVCRRMTRRGIAIETSNSTASRKLNGATKTFLLPLIAAITLCAFLTNIIWTHPGSGIVVGQKGQVFFIDTGNPDVRLSGCIWEINVQGKLNAGNYFKRRKGAPTSIAAPPKAHVRPEQGQLAPQCCFAHYGSMLPRQAPRALGC